MKFVVLLAVLAIAYLLWRNNRVADRDAAARDAARRALGAPQEMVRCAACQVHLPRTDAVPGTEGRLFCSHDHRLAHERRD